jgi:hypothetical protein
MVGATQAAFLVGFRGGHNQRSLFAVWSIGVLLATLAWMRASKRSAVLGWLGLNLVMLTIAAVVVSRQPSTHDHVYGSFVVLAALAAILALLVSVKMRDDENVTQLLRSFAPKTFVLPVFVMLASLSDGGRAAFVLAVFFVMPVVSLLTARIAPQLLVAVAMQLLAALTFVSIGFFRTPDAKLGGLALACVAVIVVMFARWRARFSLSEQQRLQRRCIVWSDMLFKRVHRAIAMLAKHRLTGKEG